MESSQSADNGGWFLETGCSTAKLAIRPLYYCLMIFPFNDSANAIKLN